MKRLALSLAILGSLFVASPSVSAASCATGDECALGDLGPGGGRVIYVAPTPRWWGTYIEARPIANGRGLPWSLRPTESIYTDSEAGTANRQRIDARAVGMGAVNTAAIIAQNGEGRYAAAYVANLSLGGKSDWYLPSKDELDYAYHRATIGQWSNLYKASYWTSTENSASYSWYQMFQDSTQFTDENGVGRVNDIPIKSNKDRVRNAKHGMSGFPSLLYRLMPTRAFGPINGVQPPISNPVLTGNTCTAQGPCELGDIGPAGGVVFYDGGPNRVWGRYLEASPSSTEAVGLTWKRLSVNDRIRRIYYDTPTGTARLKRVASKLIGAGKLNTTRIIRTYGKGTYAARYAASLVVNGFDDWFLPSEDELEKMHTFMQTANTPIDPLKRSYYWSSSEYDYDNAWTVNFKDGQQFDRMKWTVPGPAIKAIRTRAIRSFG
jgi:hypothetical protein